MLGARCEHDDVRLGNPGEQARVGNRLDGIGGKEALQRSRPFSPQLLSLFGGRQSAEEINVLQVLWLVGGDDVGLGGEQVPVTVNRDQAEIGTVGHVFDHAGGNSHQPGVVLDGVVEVSADLEEASGENQIAQAAIGEAELVPGAGTLLLEAIETVRQKVGGTTVDPADQVPQRALELVRRWRPAFSKLSERCSRLLESVLIGEAEIEQLDQPFLAGMQLGCEP